MTTTTRAARRDHWRSLSRQDKHELLRELRHRQQRQVELEMLRLRHHAR